MAKKIILDSNEKGDILEVHLGKPREAVGGETSDDVFVHYDCRETSEWELDLPVKRENPTQSDATRNTFSG